MKTSNKGSMTLAVLVATTLATVGSPEQAAARRPRPQPCRPGRYVVDGGPLTLGGAGVIADDVLVETHDGVVSVGDECHASIQRYVGVRKGKRGRRSAVTVLRARGAECGSNAEPVRVRARIDGLCDAMKGTVRVGKELVRFTAHRPAGGLNDCVEPDAPEMAIHTYQRINAAWLDDRPASAITTAFFETARRYALGEDPQSTLERDLHKRFAAMGPDAQQLLSCAAHNYSFMRNIGDTRLFSNDVFAGESDPVTYAGLTSGLSRELIRLVDATLGWAEECSLEERPGYPRREFIVDPDGGIQNEHYTPRICTVQSVPTADFVPSLTYPDLQENYTLETDCKVTTNDTLDDCPPLEVDNSDECPGSVALRNPETGKFFCYRVPWFQQGDTVTLRGLNFRDTGIKVELRNKNVPSNVRTVDAHVCGDTATPATEVVDGETKTILDCRRVSDQLSFVVPADLPAGIFEVRLFIPKSNPLFGRESTPAYIRILLPPQAEYSLVADSLSCVDPTNWEWGSDEVGLKFVSTRIGLDGSIAPVSSSNFRRGDVDKGDVIPLKLSLGSVSGPNLGAFAVAIVGHEIDDGDAYAQGISEFDEAYDHFLQTGWKNFAEDAGSLAERIAQEAGAGGWSKVIGQSLEQTIHVYYAAWAPADLILADHIGISNVEMSELTSISYPTPPAELKTGPEGIKIGVEPIGKGPNYYREYRRYWGNDASSTYSMFFNHYRR